MWSGWEVDQNNIVWRWNGKKLDGSLKEDTNAFVLSTAYTFFEPATDRNVTNPTNMLMSSCKNYGCRICNMGKSSNSNDQCICSVQKFLFLSTVYIFCSLPHFVKWPILPQCQCKKCCNLGIGNICNVYSTKVSVLSTVNIFFVSCHRS